MIEPLGHSPQGRELQAQWGLRPPAGGTLISQEAPPTGRLTSHLGGPQAPKFTAKEVAGKVGSPCACPVFPRGAK